MKLLVTLERDETGMVVAECPSIPGCVSQGATESEALEPRGYRRLLGSAEGEQQAVDNRGTRGRGRRVVPALPSVSGIDASSLPHSCLSVSQHRELAPGTLRSLIRASGMSVVGFIAASRKEATVTVRTVGLESMKKRAVNETD